jgi:TetR/AcrR family transcriptional regulator, regulator of autoinduction and epiphytic fitness
MTTSAARVRTKKTARRLGVESSETRAQLIGLAARLIRDEGCAAVTARRLAEDLGLKRQIVHYYFGTIEDLIIAVIRRSVGKLHERVKRQLDSDEPLRAIYQLGNTVTAAVFEFTALAMRSKAIRAEMQHYTEEFRKIQAGAIARYLQQRGISPGTPPAVTALVMNSIAYTLAVEAALGVSEGHVETRALMEEWLRAFAHDGEWIARNKATL